MGAQHLIIVLRTVTIKTLPIEIQKAKPFIRTVEF